MYNRYIPQSDGSYARSRMPDAAPPGNGPQTLCENPGTPSPAPGCPPEPPADRCPPPAPAGGFLRQLLPKGLDTGDLLIIVLLLLMAGDCQEDKNIMLLTLALYLFL